jgi:hypothetical protein
VQERLQAIIQNKLKKKTKYFVTSIAHEVIDHMTMRREKNQSLHTDVMHVDGLTSLDCNRATTAHHTYHW